MDTTGSMRNELADVQANLLGVIRVLARLAPSLRVGFVAFKDHGAAYVTQSFRLSPMSQDNVVKVIGSSARCRPRAAATIPSRSTRRWRSRRRWTGARDAQGQIVVIGDAPVRPAGRGGALALAERFRGSAPDLALPRSVSAIFTGESPAARIFFEQVARAGGGEFSAYEGQIIENVLLSVLRDPAELASR